jgi:predicted CopG family antitoxin
MKTKPIRVSVPVYDALNKRRKKEKRTYSAVLEAMLGV